MAKVTLLVGVNGDPKDVRVMQGLGFGTDEKAAAAVKHYRFIPATKHGAPIETGTDVLVPFAKF